VTTIRKNTSVFAIRKIASAFVLRAFLLFVCFTATLTLAHADESARPLGPARDTETPSAHGSQQDCRFLAPADTPNDPIFRGLHNVALYVSVPSATSGKYPSPLDVEHLTQSFAERITTEILPHAPLRRDCQRPPLVILDNKNVEQFRDDPAALTVVVTLTIIEKTKPRLAILKTHFYRPNPSASGVADQARLNQVTAIPLNFSNPIIAQLVSDFVNLLQVPTDRGIAH